MKKIMVVIAFFLAVIPALAQKPICEEIDHINHPIRVGDRVLMSVDVYSLGKGTVVSIGPGSPGVRLSDSDGEELFLFIRLDELDPREQVFPRGLDKILCSTGPTPGATGVNIGIPFDRVQLLKRTQ